MPSSTALNIFLEPQPVTASAVTSSGERMQAYGVAQLTEFPFIKVQFPQSNLTEVKKVEKGTQVIVCFEVDHTVLTLYTNLVEAADQGALLLKIEQYEHKKQKRIATRVPAHGAWAEYQPMQDQAVSSSDQRWYAEIINISKTGLLMRLDEIIEPNQRVALTLHLSEISLVNCWGRVVRLALQRSGEIEAAVQLEDMNDFGQAWINHYSAET